MNVVLELVNKLISSVDSSLEVIISVILHPAFWITAAALLIIYLVICIYKEIRIRQLALDGSRVIDHRKKIGLIEKFAIGLQETARFAAGLIVKIPLIAGVLVVVLLAGMLAGNISGISTYIYNQERLQELRLIVKQLQKRYKVAAVEITSIESGATTMDITYLDYSGTGEADIRQRITIEGTDIYFDSIVVNFDYSLIEDGSKLNLTIPNKVYSGVVSYDDGVKLDFMNSRNVPYMYARDDDEVYGMDSFRYDVRVAELMDIIYDEERSRELGVRSLYGNAVHRPVAEGDVFSIWIEQTGGLVLSTAE